jgi:site-specific recombinase XerC
MGSRPGLGYFLLRRLDSRMAISESRHQAKLAIREATGEKRWSVSTGRIHSFTTRDTYQQHILAFVDWVKARHPGTTPAMLDSHADAWVSQYLRERIAEGYSASTLATIRSALRLCFWEEVAASVELPMRSRQAITRSRVPVEQDAHFQPQHWAEHVLFAQATGLRRSEMRDVRVGDISVQPDGSVRVHVRRGKGGKARDVTVLAGSEQAILALLEGREPQERLFQHIPKNMDVQSYRRAFAQAYYQQQAQGRALPPQDAARLKPGDYDLEACQQVAEALGHSRLRRGIVLSHYLR